MFQVTNLVNNKTALKKWLICSFKIKVFTTYFFFQEIHVNLLTHLGKLLCFPDTR